MKLFTFDAKFEQAGRDPAALEKLLAWHQAARKQFGAIAAILVGFFIFVLIYGGIFVRRVFIFLDGKEPDLPKIPLGLDANLITMMTPVMLTFIVTLGTAFHHNEACIKMLLLHRGARQKPVTPENP